MSYADDDYADDDGMMGGDGGDDGADELIGMMVGMGTLMPDEDKMRAFQAVCGFDEAQARFYLEASSWNVDMAVSAFFANTIDRSAEAEAQHFHCTAMDPPGASRIQGVPGSVVHHVWNLRNTGMLPWPAGSYVNFLDGDPMGFDAPIVLDREIAVNEDVPLQLPLALPFSDHPIVHGRWHMFLPDQTPFGEPLTISVQYPIVDWGMVPADPEVSMQL